MCYIYKDNQKSAYIQNLYWVYADYIRQLSYERTFSVPSSLKGLFLCLSGRGKGGEEMNCGLQDCYSVYVNIAKCKIVLNI